MTVEKNRDWEESEQALLQKASEIAANPGLKKKVLLKMSRCLWKVPEVGERVLPVDDHHRKTWFDPRNGKVFVPAEKRRDNKIWEAVEENVATAMFVIDQEDALKASGDRSIMPDKFPEESTNPLYED